MCNERGKLVSQRDNSLHSPEARMATTTWNAAVLAESDGTIAGEANHDLSPDAPVCAHIVDRNKSAHIKDHVALRGGVEAAD